MVENLWNCYEIHGFYHTGEYCEKKQSVVNDKFFYKLMNKYKCLTSNDNEFPQIDVPEEVSVCLNLYYDYKIETCLELYEDQFKNNSGFAQVGFYGHDSSIDTTDDYELRRNISREDRPNNYDGVLDLENPDSVNNIYWTKYGNLAISLLIPDANDT